MPTPPKGNKARLDIGWLLKRVRTPEEQARQLTEEALEQALRNEKRKEAQRGPS